LISVPVFRNYKSTVIEKTDQVIINLDEVEPFDNLAKEKYLLLGKLAFSKKLVSSNQNIVILV
jgi:hypothetical protein